MIEFKDVHLLFSGREILSGISMQIPYAAAPIGSALMIYHLLVVIFSRQSNARADTELQV